MNRDDIPQLLGATEIRALAEQLNLVPTKKLGQNFVIDANTVRKIVRLADVHPGDAVLEIGPGLGSLTLGLLEAGAAVTAVELDGRLAEQLPVTVRAHQPEAQLTVVHADGMTIHEGITPPRRLVANLPYNVSVPILLHVLDTFGSLETAVVMVQAEVGHRIAAEPGSRVYGVPSVKAAWYGEWTVVGQVSRQVFWPVPNVDSVLIGYRRFEQPRGTTEQRELTFQLVDAAFGQRRKMLRQSLKALLGDRVVRLCEVAGVSEESRAEQLSVEDFHRLARAALAESS